MGNESSRSQRVSRQGTGQSPSPTPAPQGMPPHLANQYRTGVRPEGAGGAAAAPSRPSSAVTAGAAGSRPSAPPGGRAPAAGVTSGTSGGAARNPVTEPSAPTAPAPGGPGGANGSNTGAGGANNSNSSNNPATRRTVQEGQMIKMLATVEPSTVTFDPATCLLSFCITSTCPNVTYEIHTGVKETIRDGVVTYIPNKQKWEPIKTLIKEPQDSKAITVKVDMSLMSPQEIRYDQHYPKQRPCIIVIRYFTNGPKKGETSGEGEADNGKNDSELQEHSEHTSVDLSENPRKQRVISQIINTGGAAYTVENLYDVGMPGEVVLAPTIEAHEGEEDEDGLCVVCWTEPKDTAVMPCRHMCLCQECAEKLMRQTPKCPVCRGTISTLLHMPSSASANKE